MHLARLDAEDVAWKIERADLASPVIQHPVGSHRTGDDLIKVLCRVVFPVNLGIAGESHRSADHAQRAVGNRSRTHRNRRTDIHRGFGGCSEHGRYSGSVVGVRNFARSRDFRNLDISPKYNSGALRNFTELQEKPSPLAANRAPAIAMDVAGRSMVRLA